MWSSPGKGDSESEGMKLAAEHGIETAPFFLVSPDNGETRVYTRLFEFIKKELDVAPAAVSSDCGVFDTVAAGERYDDMEPADILADVQRSFGTDLALAFSGAEDVALIDMASQNGLPFTVFCLDTGRLHPETYGFIDIVRDRYGIEIEVFTPSPSLLEPFLREKGLNSFYRDGHTECCGIRKVEPLSRALSSRMPGRPASAGTRVRPRVTIWPWSRKMRITGRWTTGPW